MADPTIPVKVRTARKPQRCSHRYPCGGVIEPGERYELHVAPPWADGNESPHWYRSMVHAPGPYGARNGPTGCELSAAYREHQRRAGGAA